MIRRQLFICFNQYATSHNGLQCLTPPFQPPQFPRVPRRQVPHVPGAGRQPERVVRLQQERLRRPLQQDVQVEALLPQRFLQSTFQISWPNFWNCLPSSSAVTPCKPTTGDTCKYPFKLTTTDKWYYGAARSLSSTGTSPGRKTPKSQLGNLSDNARANNLVNQVFRC